MMPGHVLVPVVVVLLVVVLVVVMVVVVLVVIVLLRVLMLHDVRNQRTDVDPRRVSSLTIRIVVTDPTHHLHVPVTRLLAFQPSQCIPTDPGQSEL